VNKAAFDERKKQHHPPEPFPQLKQANQAKQNKSSKTKVTCVVACAVPLALFLFFFFKNLLKSSFLSI